MNAWLRPRYRAFYRLIKSLPRNRNWSLLFFFITFFDGPIHLKIDQLVVSTNEFLSCIQINLRQFFHNINIALHFIFQLDFILFFLLKILNNLLSICLLLCLHVNFVFGGIFYMVRIITFIIMFCDFLTALCHDNQIFIRFSSF